MSDEILNVRIDKETKEALKSRAFDLHLDGGMSELVKMLIDKELKEAKSFTPSTTCPTQPAQ